MSKVQDIRKSSLTFAPEAGTQRLRDAINKNVTEEEWNAIKEETPLMKIGKPIDITRCVKWLLEDEFTTGQVISPNGGLVIT